MPFPRKMQVQGSGRDAWVPRSRDGQALARWAPAAQNARPAGPLHGSLVFLGLMPSALQDFSLFPWRTKAKAWEQCGQSQPSSSPVMLGVSFRVLAARLSCLFSFSHPRVMQCLIFYLPVPLSSSKMCSWLRL